MSTRIESLDWLRGMMAISIMLYHLTYWLVAPLDASGFLGRMGIYAVSVFFVLSGLSMAIVYEKYICDVRTSLFFFVRRLFRIWPLLWICVALAIFPSLYKGYPVDALKVLLNLTTLFGFVSPGSYINTGAWSIGNEMVYYALTPFVIHAYNKRLLYGNALLGAAVLVGAVFAFNLLKAGGTLADQWTTYIHPFNNLFLFVAGVGIHYNLRDVQVPPGMSALAGALALMVLVFFPVSGDHIHIVVGPNRVLFCIATVALVVSFYKLASHDFMPRHIAGALGGLGAATYGIYLLHPLVLMYLQIAGKRLGFRNDHFVFVATCVLTIVLALASYHGFEKRMMGLGKRMTRTPARVVRGSRA